MFFSQNMPAGPAKSQLRARGMDQDAMEKIPAIRGDTSRSRELRSDAWKHRGQCMVNPIHNFFHTPQGVPWFNGEMLQVFGTIEGVSYPSKGVQSYRN